MTEMTNDQSHADQFADAYLASGSPQDLDEIRTVFGEVQNDEFWAEYVDVRDEAQEVHLIMSDGSYAIVYRDERTVSVDNSYRS